MWRSVALYGAALAAFAVALNWIEFQWLARSHPGELYFGLTAIAFLALGVWAGARLFGGRAPLGPEFTLNTNAQASLGITEREMDVLRQLAAGRSNKEIASALKVSPNTVKSHVARLFEKLDAARRTEAILKARELGLIQ